MLQTCPIVWADFWIYSSLINIPDLYNSDPKYTFYWTQTTKLFSGVKQNQTERRNHIQPVTKRNWRGFDTFISTGLNNPSRCLNIFEPVHTSLTLFLFHKNQIDSVLHLAHVFSPLRCMLGNYSAFKKIKISQSPVLPKYTCYDIYCKVDTKTVNHCNNWNMYFYNRKTADGL